MLYEREDALDAVSQVLDAARRGSGGSILLIGEAGTGKTTLLQGVVEMAQSASPAGHQPIPVRLATARGAAMEADLPFAFADQFVGVTLPLASYSDPGSSMSPKARRAAIYESARSQLTEWAGTGPVVVILDDLHWADPDSLELIGYLARRLADHPIAIVGALRSWPAAAAMLARSLAQGAHARVVDTHALSKAASASLLVELTAKAVGTSSEPYRLSTDVLNRAWLLSRGNPLLVGQAALTIAETGGLPEAGDANLARLQRTLLLSHLAGLDARALECAKAAAVLRTRIRLAVLEKVAGMEEDDFVDAFDALVGAGVLIYEGEGYAEFSHDLLASAVYGDTLPARRQALHARAFAHHADLGDVAAAAPHALAAELRGDERALGVLVEAGMRALGDGAIQTGIAQLRAAVGMAGRGASPELLGRLADSLFFADCAGDALAVYQAILARPLSPGMRLDILGKAARAQAFVGEVDRAMSAYRSALDELSQAAHASDTGGSLSSLLAERAHVAWEADGPAAALTMLDPTSSPIWPDPEPSSLSALRAYMQLNLGDRSGLDVVVSAAIAGRHSTDFGLREANRSLNLLLIHPGALAFTERFDEALALIAYAQPQYSAAGSLRSSIGLATLRASILLNQGRLVEVLTEAEAEGVGDGDDLLGRPRLALIRAEALTRQGRIEESIAICDLIEASNSVRSQFATFNLGVARAQHLAAKGAAIEAASGYLSLESLARKVGVASMCTARWAAGSIESALAAGRAEDALRVAAWIEEAGKQLGCTWPTMLALGARAGASVEEADDASTDAQYTSALGACTVLPLQRAAIALRYGAWLRRSGQVSRARAVLAECVGSAEAAGEEILAGAARAELSVAGGRRRRARRPSALTGQETRVAQMAVGGATTREIAKAMYLSPRTVESHLAHAYAKLGVHSKSELRLRRSEVGL